MNKDRVGDIQIARDGIVLPGMLGEPAEAQGIVLFAHGSGSGRFSPRNQGVARRLREAGFATLLFDLLTAEEEALDRRSGSFRFHIEFLSKRLMLATDWVLRDERTRHLGIGYFGASTGAAAAIVAAAQWPEPIQAVVSRGGRPDMAGNALEELRAPTLLIVGGRDETVLALNEEALLRMKNARRKLSIIERAGHLFEEAGALDEVAELAVQWFSAYLHRSDTSLQQAESHP